MDRIVDTETTKMTTQALLFGLKRLNNIDDPVLRYTMLVELIRMGGHVMCLALEKSIENDLKNLEEKLEDLQEETDKNTKAYRRNLSRLETGIDNLNKTEESLKVIDNELSKYLDSFGLWIKQPIYSPDHPFGNKIMNDANVDFSNKQ
jgi:hypothetical protein